MSTTSAAGGGRVFIVGAGPGDPDLLTVKALRLLRAADVIVFDRLVSQEILDLIPAGTARVFAGKMARNHHMPQSDINALLATLAASGRMVVRLKGGDPYLFCRGGEEALHLAAQDIPFEVVPGVTSASGCSAAAGIPLTHRDFAHRVQLITGHAKENEPLALDWAKLAEPDATLVIYMGRTNIGRISAELIRHGLPPDTPAAAVVNGTRADQLTISANLSDLPGAMRHLDRAAPTLIFIGKVAALADQLGPRVPGSASPPAAQVP